MKTPRNVKRSFYAALETLFKDASTFGTAFNVYYESDLRDKVVPVRPHLYILDANVEVKAEYLPTVAVWFNWGYRLFQMGGDAIWHGDVSVEVYGANRGDREDIAAAIAEGINNQFTINDYSGASATPWGTASIYEDASGNYWSLEPGSVADELAVEGTVLNWMSASSRFWCRPS